MADKALPSVGNDSVDEALQRLSKKPGVKAWIMLDRSTGAVLKTNGQISSVRPARSGNGSSTPSNTNNPSSSFAADAAADANDETQAAQELGALVWSFLSTAGSMIQEMDTEDELKLLRLRTKKQELVIVPELKYIMVVIHETPAA